MSLTSARVLDGTDTWGLHGVSIRKFTGDAAYPAGGYALNGSNFGFGNKPLEGVVVLGALTALAANFAPIYDLLNKKLVINAGGGGTVTYAQSDIKGSTITDLVGAGNYSTIQTNAALISALAAADNTTAFTIATQPDIGRVVSVSIKDTSAGAASGNAADYVIVGTFRGAAQTETISFSAANLATMSNGNIAIKFGVKPFDTVTSITPSAAQPTGFEHAAGVGSKIGLPQPTLNNAESDIIRLTKNAAVLTITGTYSTNGTVNFGVLADGDDISAEYRAASGAAPSIDLSGCTWVLMGVCRGT